MFGGKKLTAEATILADEGWGSVVDTDIHGRTWVHNRFIIEVRPDGEPTFRTEVKHKVCVGCMPQVGDKVKVVYDAKDHKADLDLDGDDRYDPKVRAAQRQAKVEAQREALLSGANPGDDPDDDELRLLRELEASEARDAWTPPAKCPSCGAPIDPDQVGASEHRCPFCHVAPGSAT